MLFTNKIIYSLKQTRPLFFDRERSGEIREKGANDFVTETDTSVQAFLRRELYALEPSVQFLGEESSDEIIDFTKDVWVLDPVDGTTNLIHDFQMSVVSLALVQNGIVTLGVIYWPYMDELFYAAKGEGAFLNGCSISVSDVSRPQDSLIMVGPSPHCKEAYADLVMGITGRIFRQCQEIRILGSAALNLAYVACGRADGFYEKILKPWDYAAGSLIVEEAGGRVVRWDKSLVSFQEDCDILADNGNMGDWLAEALK